MSISSTHPLAIDGSDLDCYRDAAWALRDTEVQAKYAGQWVVAYRRQVIAHGLDADEVLYQATRLVPNVNHRVVFCSPDEPLADSPDEPLDFTHA